ncbi:Hypothetical protein, putative [Bodo saltans]|uniref:RRM domain-containing protein n=1 Tax=Bodo saltans TaxID=75058 RepID=A0A0S4IX72_BODSA|nr:Hypothetical protein, putative [Bodo saltans]|eukprot:CUG06634.1 Hypothetical protein, putative [Bodo saltans]
MPHNNGYDPRGPPQHHQYHFFFNTTSTINHRHNSINSSSSSSGTPSLPMVDFFFNTTSTINHRHNSIISSSSSGTPSLPMVVDRLLPMVGTMPPPPHFQGGGSYDNNNNNTRSYPLPPQHHHHHHHHHQQQQQPYGGGGGGAPGGYQPRVYETREATNTVWVGNLEPHHTDELLRYEFAPFGRVMRIARVEGKNFLFVHYRQKEEAQTAVQTLSQNGALGRARFNYGKQFDYNPEDLDLPWDPSQPHQFFGGTERRPRDPQDDGFRGGNSGGYENRGERPKRSRDDEAVPSNVLWAANIPPTLTTEELRQNFESFGAITSVSRIAERNMAFIHFSSVEECRHALDVMRGQPIGGAVLVLNYGRPQRTNDNVGGGASGGDSAANLMNEFATNVVYLGNIASNVSHDEVDRIFDQFNGFINAKYISGNGIAFGHFDTVENARSCRVALIGQLLGGAPFRVNFGKANHTMTMADRRPGGAAGSGSHGGVDLSTIDPFNASALFALTTTTPTPNDFSVGALTIPAMGSGGSSGALALTVGGTAVPKFFTRDRPVPTISVETRILALNAATYFNCGEHEKNLRPNVVQDICDDIDKCVDSATEAKLDTEISYFAPLNASHCFAIAAKRLKEHFNDDRHKKLYVLYACSRVLFGTRTTQLAFSKHSMWSFLLLLTIVAADQDTAGLDQVRIIVDRLKTASSFYIANNFEDAFVQEFQEQLDAVIQRATADQEMAQFAKRRRK